MATVSLSGTLTNNAISAYYDFPDSGSFFHGELAISPGATGTFNINTVNEYVSKCVTSYTSSVKIYDGNQVTVNAGRAPLIGQASITMTSTC